MLSLLVYPSQYYNDAIGSSLWLDDQIYIKLRPHFPRDTRDSAEWGYTSVHIFSVFTAAD